MSYLRSALLAIAIVFVGPATFSPAFAAEENDTPAAEHDHDGAGHGDEEGSGEDAGHGDGDHAEAPMPDILSYDPGSAIANLVIFLCVFGLLAKLVWPVILNGLKTREEKIASDLSEAQAANQQAAVKLAEYEKKVSDAAVEAQGILAEARSDAQTNATKIVDEAKADAKRQGDRALADIETAKKVALADIANQTSALAIGVAKQVVGRELKADDHAELIRNALDQVPSKN